MIELQEEERRWFPPWPQRRPRIAAPAHNLRPACLQRWSQHRHGGCRCVRRDVLSACRQSAGLVQRGGRSVSFSDSRTISDTFVNAETWASFRQVGSLASAGANTRRLENPPRRGVGHSVPGPAEGEAPNPSQSQPLLAALRSTPSCTRLPPRRSDRSRQLRCGPCGCWPVRSRAACMAGCVFAARRRTTGEIMAVKAKPPSP